MIIGVNAKNEIKQIGKITDKTLHQVEISDTHLDTMSKFMLLNYRYIPQGEDAYVLEPMVDFETLVKMDAMNTEKENLKAISNQQDILLLEADIRIMDIEFAIEDLMDTPVVLNARTASTKGSSYGLLLRMVTEGNYTSKKAMENNIKKYYDRGRISEEEYEALLSDLYPEEETVQAKK